MTRSYNKLRKSDRGLQGFTGGYKGLQGVTRVASLVAVDLASFWIVRKQEIKKLTLSYNYQ